MSAEAATDTLFPANNNGCHDHVNALERKVCLGTHKGFRGRNRNQLYLNRLAGTQSPLLSKPLQGLRHIHQKVRSSTARTVGVHMTPKEGKATGKVDISRRRLGIG